MAPDTVQCSYCHSSILRAVAFCPRCGKRQKAPLSDSDLSADPYAVLQVTRDAEREVIEAAYKGLAKKYHPDVSSSQASAERMRQVNWAYNILSDPARRKDWDLRQDVASRPGTAAYQEPATPSTRAPSEPTTSPRPRPPSEPSSNRTAEAKPSHPAAETQGASSAPLESETTRKHRSACRYCGQLTSVGELACEHCGRVDWHGSSAPGESPPPHTQSETPTGQRAPQTDRGTSASAGTVSTGDSGPPAQREGWQSVGPIIAVMVFVGLCVAGAIFAELNQSRSTPAPVYQSPVHTAFHPTATTTPSPVPSPTPAYEFTVAVSASNIRSGPGTTYSIVGSVRNGALLLADGTSPDGNWLRVTVKDSELHGWVFAKAVEPQAQTTLLPTFLYVASTPGKSSSATTSGEPDQTATGAAQESECREFTEYGADKEGYPVCALGIVRYISWEAESEFGGKAAYVCFNSLCEGLSVVMEEPADPGIAVGECYAFTGTVFLYSDSNVPFVSVWREGQIQPCSSVVSPTPTPTATKRPTLAPTRSATRRPTARPRPTSTRVPRLDVVVTVYNRASGTLYLTVRGPMTTSINVAAGSYNTLSLTAGTYTYIGKAPGYEDTTGTKYFSAGEWTWDWYDED